MQSLKQSRKQFCGGLMSAGCPPWKGQIVLFNEHNLNSGYLLNFVPLLAASLSC